jgi:surface antigen
MDRMVRPSYVTLAAALLMLGWASPSDAQMSNPLGRRGTEALTADDFAAVKPALGGLLDNGADGASATWKSEKSGNNGSLEVVRSFDRKGLKCREVKHLISLKSEANPRQISLSYCRIADGSWKILD